MYCGFVSFTLFIKSKDSYIPYNASLKEYNAKGEIVRHSFYGNGFKNIVQGAKITVNNIQNVQNLSLTSAEFEEFQKQQKQRA